jgi:hypothetical protein
MSIPVLFLGQAEDDGVLACGESYADAGEVYAARIRSNPAASDDTEERIWPAAILTLSHRVPLAVGTPGADTVLMTVRAIVDDVEVAEETFTLTLTPISDPDDPPARVRRTYEVPFFIPRLRSAVEVGKTVPAGTNFQLELEWPGSDVAVDAARVEWETTGETRVTV